MEFGYSVGSSGRFTEQSPDKVDLSADTRGLVRDVAVLDGPDRLDREDRRLCRPQGAERLPRPEQALQCGVVALDPVVPPFPVDMQDTVEVRIVAVVQVLGDPAVSRCLIRADGARAVEPDAVDGLP